MPDEFTPEIEESEYSSERQGDLPTVTGPETTDQIISSWFDDPETIDPELVLPTDGTDVPTDVQATPMPEVPEDGTSQLPDDWTQWVAPTDPADDSWTDEGYSPDWGQVISSLPEEIPVDDVVGPGHAADQYWDNQGATNYCALYSTASIIGEMFDQPVDIDDMVARAEASGWLVHDANGEVLGVYAANIDDLLASYGVASHNVTGEQGAWESLNSALTNDQRVVVFLDSDEITAGANDGTEVDANHFISVTGIDYERNVVIVNDSARSAGLEIPLDVFYDAWRDGDFQMTITDSSAPAPADAMPPTGSAGLDPDAPGFTLLPFTLHAQAAAPQLPEPELS